MSKSKGNVVDPFILAERYGVDAIRYYLLREIPFGSDGSYTNEEFIGLINKDLCNDLGNLARRTLAMSRQYFGGKVTNAGEAGEGDEEFVSAIDSLRVRTDEAIDKINPSKALEEVFAVIDKANKYIDLTRPWVLAKENNRARLERVMYNLLEALRVCSIMLLPFIPTSPARILDGLGIAKPDSFDPAKYGEVGSYQTHEIEVLFPRIDVEKELKEMEKLAEAANKPIAESDKDAANKSAAEANKDTAKKPATEANKDTAKKPAAEPKEEEKEEVVEISADEFFRTRLAVGKILACEKVEKADKLLKSTVDLGNGDVRTILSGIAKFYTPEEMVGKSVVVVTNLAPRKIRGIESRGMLLCAADGDKLCLVTPEKDAEAGTEVC